MKFDSVWVLGLGALTSVVAQECPAGYSMSVSYITVTAEVAVAAEPTTTVSNFMTTTSTIIVTRSSSDEAATVATTSTSSALLNAVEESVSVSSSSTPVASSSTAAAVAAATSTTSLGSPVSGEATFFSGNVAGGACSFSTYTLPSDIFGTALSDSNWDNSANCGACVSVTGPSGNNITAMVSILSLLDLSLIPSRSLTNVLAVVKTILISSPRLLKLSLRNPKVSSM